MQFTVEDLTNLFHVTEKTVYRWIKNEALPACQVHHQYRFNRLELLEWAAQRRLDLPPGLLDGGPSAQAEAPRLSESLAAGGIFDQVEGQDKTAVLTAIVDRLQLPPGTDRALLLAVLRAREEMGSTAIGEGIAIPHPRNPIVLRVERPLVMLCFLAHPIDFGALDGRPVDTLFTLIAPTTHAHLSLLSRLMAVLHDAGFKDLLARRAAPAMIMDEARRAEAALGRPA